MNSLEFYKVLRNEFALEPTNQQDIFFQKISEFVTNNNTDELFVLKGYAGTGKTTIISHLVNLLHLINKKYVLLAPTGRASKVMSHYSNQKASTIHKRIYYPKKNKNGGIGFTMQANKFKNTIFIVDEASMISDQYADSGMYQNGSLLDDLLFYVENGQNCKILMVGDTAQLPPVNQNLSPALDIIFLTTTYLKDIVHIELDEVMRQSSKSGILHNATHLRELLKMNVFEEIKVQINKFKDIIHLIDGYEIQDAIVNSYSNFSVEDTAIIVRSNKRANLYNQQIRHRILGRESEIATGDLLMVVKNNYFWLDEKTEAGFIANGDTIEVLRVVKTIDLYGFTFAHITARMIDYDDLPHFETIVLLHTLHSESPSLTYEESNKLYQEVYLDYQDEIAHYKRVARVKLNPYFNALQVKFSYAFTCHKAQGGQWHTVFVEKPYVENIDSDYIRWLYTAFTRAKTKLYLIGFS